MKNQFLLHRMYDHVLFLIYFEIFLRCKYCVRKLKFVY